MRTPGTLIRALSVLAAGGAAVYFWSTALSGRTAAELLRGGSSPTLVAAPATPEPTVRMPRVSPPVRRPSVPTRPRARVAVTLEPGPAALAEAVAYVRDRGSLP